MNFKEWMDLLFKQEERILYYWKTSTWFNVIALGWCLLILRNDNVQLTFKVSMLLSICYLLGYLFSLFALLRSFKTFAIYFKASLRATKQAELSELIETKRVNIHFMMGLAVCLHLIYLLVVCILIWLPNWF